MNRTRVGLALALALVHYGCCSCDDTPTAPPIAATPTPTPAPTPTPVSCTEGPLNPAAVCRSQPPPAYENDVVRAQAEVRATRPELFDSQGGVISAQSYTGWVATVLRSYGYCAAAVGGGGDEVGVKRTNDFNEQYDIVTGAGLPWTAYQVTCRPPLF